MKVTIHDSDHGYKEMLSNLKELAAENTTLEVGITEQSGSGLASSGNASILDVAWILELGTEDGHIPARPFVRAWFDANQEKALAVLQALIRRVAAGKQTKESALEQFGRWGAGEMQKYITDGAGVPPPNAPATVRKKGSDHTLIDTGELRAAITYLISYGE